MERERLPELDLLRFIAAASVVLFHSTHWPFPRTPFANACSFGFMGVPLFFTISGFVILMTAEKRNGIQFINSRISRLYPSFWICVLLSTLALATLGSGLPPLATIAANLTMQPLMVFDQPYIDNVYWTLAIEMKFYGLMLLLILTHQVKRVEWFLALWLAVAWLANLFHAPHWLQSLAIPRWASLFISGCYFYLIRSRGPTIPRSIGLTASVALSMVSALAYQEGYTSTTDPTTLGTVLALVLLINVAFLFVALRKWALPHWAGWLWLGCLTYPLYLTHSKIGQLIWRALPGDQWMRLWFTLAVALVISAVLAMFVERRFCGAFNKFLNRTSDKVLEKIKRALAGVNLGEIRERHREASDTR